MVCTICLLFSLGLPHLFPGRGHTVALHSAAPTLVHDQGLDPDQDQGLILIRPVDPAPVPAPMVDPILVPLILGAMDAVLDTHGLDPGLVQGLMGTGGLAHHGLLSLTEAEDGMGEKEQDLTGLDHGLVHQGAIGVAALVGENHLSGSLDRMN